MNAPSREPPESRLGRACTRIASQYVGAESRTRRVSERRIHVCPQAYVSMHCGGHDADERRFVARSYE
ncbi:MAG: hypothetical protein O8C66_04690 [Candidatus Methanoperedens sp.]|nr:hypothetical protein [Candidatus Methanoperedens sp.]MCZ7369785.1 hypothetical protein [Candidatus Methanoperedens sp.]